MFNTTYVQYIRRVVWVAYIQVNILQTFIYLLIKSLKTKITLFIPIGVT